MPLTVEHCGCLPSFHSLTHKALFGFPSVCTWRRAYRLRMCWPEAPGASVMSIQQLCLLLSVCTGLCGMRHSLGALVTLSLPGPAGVKALLDMLAGHILEPERPTSWPRHEVPLLRSCHPSGLGATSPGNALYLHWPYLPLT